VLFVLTSPLLASLGWIEHGFGLRTSGLSQDEMASLRQIHSAIPLVSETAGCVGEGDALLTIRPGLAVSVRTADCYPILLACGGPQKAVAVVHAGWRGTADRIVERTIAKLSATCGADPGQMVAAIGPGIGQCCYHVGLDVARRFGSDAAGRLDLAAENRRQLIEAGVKAPAIDLIGACTFCEPARFHSYRRDGDAAGRMISFIRVKVGQVAVLPHAEVRRR
jgi:hypothetical protein